MATELVFGQRNVEQTRGMFARANAASGGERNYLYHAAMLNRATAVLTVQGVSRPSGGACDPVSINGSGVLSGASNLTTALHVVAGVKPSETVQAGFDSPNTIDPGFFVPDLSTKYAFDDVTFRSDVREESPFLPNWLFVLGLEPWASSDVVSLAQRAVLRTEWEFRPEIRSSQEQGFTPGTFWNQGFTDTSSNAWVGRDIAVLSSPSNSAAVAGLDSLRTGGFALNDPAVFFGSVRYGETSIHGPASGARPLFGNHSSVWPEDGEVLHPLTSLPGRYGGILPPIDSAVCDDTNTLYNWKRTGLFSTSHDMIPGSSGGVLLSPNQNSTEGIPLMRTLYGTGVVSGASSQEGWDAQIQSESPNDEEFVAFSGVVSSDLMVISEGPIIGDPDRPGVIIGRTPQCLQWIEGSGGASCADWGERSGGIDSQLVIQIPPNTVFEEDETEIERVGQFGRKFDCHNRAWPGVLVGIQGGVALANATIGDSEQRISDLGGGIGTFMGVCAPYSGASYTDNWSYTKVKGGQIDRNLGTLDGQWGYGTVDEYFARVYEERGRDGSSYVRPPSAKFCPPNYLLNQLILGRVPDRDYYQDVVGLRCVKSSTASSSLPGQVEVFAQPTNPNQFKLRGKKFVLDQLIGVTDRDEQTGVVGCRQDEVAVGFKTLHDTAGRLRYISAMCMETP